MEKPVLQYGRVLNVNRENSFNSERLIAAHVPVIHKGYIDFINSYEDVPIGVFDESVTRQFDYLRKDIRALEPEQAVKALEGFGRSAFLLGRTAIEQFIRNGNRQLIMPHDDITSSLLSLYETDATNVIQEPVFLRWDRNNVDTNKIVIPDRVVEMDDFVDTIRLMLSKELDNSTDWWRHVSAALVKNGEILGASHNHGMPTEQSVYIDGDPRITQRRGSNIEASLFVHAESSLIAEMAKKGLSTEGASIFVSTFPCPNCAKLIAATGIDKCYYTEGYAMLDGYDVLKNAGVEVIKIAALDTEPSKKSRLQPYPSSQS